MDAGWPCTLYEYARGMKSIGLRLEEITWAMVTHFHLDHAGLIGEFLERGIHCLVFENQPDAIDAMEKTIAKTYPSYRPIARERLEPVTTRRSRELLEGIGIAARVIITDYHSPDSVSLITDAGEAVVGDLPPKSQMMPSDRELAGNWELVQRAGATWVYPSHAPNGPFT